MKDMQFALTIEFDRDDIEVENLEAIIEMWIERKLETAEVTTKLDRYVGRITSAQVEVQR